MFKYMMKNLSAEFVFGGYSVRKNTAVLSRKVDTLIPEVKNEVKSTDELNLKQSGVIVTDNLSFHGLVEDETKTTNRNTKQLVRKIRKYIEIEDKKEQVKKIF